MKRQAVQAWRRGQRAAEPTWNCARFTILRLRLRTTARLEMVRLGSTYGGWWVPKNILRPGVNAYCAGAGEDITFDIALHEHGCRVTVFDPTPRAAIHVERHAPHGERFRFLPVGWWSSTAELKFYAPKNPLHVSHSALNLQDTDTYFTAPAKSVASLMSELGDERVDLIKMDIEGAEHAVLSAMLAEGPTPDVLCVEFDQPQPLHKIITATKMLRQRGLEVAKIEQWNITFVRP